MARIYKQNNKWCFSINTKENGKRKRIVRGGFLREKDAKKAAREFENDLDSGKAILKQNNMTLHDYMYNTWFAYHKNFVKISTQVILNNDMKRIDRYFPASLKLRDVNSTMCMEFVNHMYFTKRLSKSTVKSTLSCLKMVFKHAFIIDKVISNNPTEYVFLPQMYSKEKELLLASKKEDKKLYLEKSEVRAFLEETRNSRSAFPFTAFFTILIYTGMRIGEVQSLQWENIDFDNKIIHVKTTAYYKPNNQFFIYSPKTKASIRDVVMPETLCNELKRYKKEFLVYKMKNRMRWIENGYDFVFVSKTQPGNPIRWSTTTSFTRRIGKRIGVDNLHPHMFRHTHVSILAAAKVPLIAIKERLGHMNDKTTEQIYLHITQQFKTEVAEKFEATMQQL